MYIFICVNKQVHIQMFNLHEILPSNFIKKKGIALRSSNSLGKTEPKSTIKKSIKKLCQNARFTSQNTNYTVWF